MRRLALAVVFLAAVVAAGVASCKQGEGDRCQIKADCGDGLVCNQATGTCQTTSGGADGQIAPDARLDAGPDAETFDADDTDAEPPDAER